MIKLWRAAACSAAMGLVCVGGAAQAQDIAAVVLPASPEVIASAEAPALPVELPVVAAPAPAAPVQASAHAAADTMLIASRARPDRTLIETVPAPSFRPAVATAAVAETGASLAHLVAAHDGAEAADEQFQCLASAVYFESRGEPLEGQLAVAEVILNRVRSGRFRGTVCDVVRQPSQFSFVRRGVIPPAPRHTAAWARAVAIAHIAMNEMHDVTGDNSLFFHATYVRPNWGRPRIARIGNHIFYR